MNICILLYMLCQIRILFFSQENVLHKWSWRSTVNDVYLVKDAIGFLNRVDEGDKMQLNYTLNKVVLLRFSLFA